MTIYNPAHLIRKLRGLGFAAKLNRTDLKVMKRIGDGQLEMGNMQFFLNLLQNHLVREDLLLSTFDSILKRIESGEILPNSRIDLDFHVIF